jgi:hypothetical protein
VRIAFEHAAIHESAGSPSSPLQMTYLHSPLDLATVATSGLWDSRRRPGHANHFGQSPQDFSGLHILNGAVRR